MLGTFLLATVATQAIAGDRPYLQLTTADTTLVSAVSESETRRIANDITTFRAAIERALGVALSSSVPTRIYALSAADWAGYARPRAGVSGYFFASPFSSDLLFDASDSTTGSLELIFHEYAHFVLRMSVSAEIPAFFDEGLAELFSAARFENGVVRIEPRREHLKMLRTRSWIPFERLLAIKRHDPEYLEHGLAPSFYAQAWATMYYALSVDPGIHSRMRAYVRALEAGDPPEKAAAALLGSDSTEVNRRVAAFIRRRGGLPVVEIAVMESGGNAAAEIRPLDHQESRLALAELLTRMGGRDEQVRELLSQLPSEGGYGARSSVIRAWLHLQDGCNDLATQLLDAVDQNLLDGRARVALARGLFQVTATTRASDLQPEQRKRLQRAETLFEMALDDRATRLEAINGYVLTRLALDERDESLITLAEIAYRAAPRSSEIAVALAILHELGGRRQTAREYWQAAARNTQTGPVRSRILEQLKPVASPAPMIPSD